MSNFFGALDSDDESPAVTRAPVAKGKAPVAPEQGDRLTGAAKKNRDQKRHGATRGGNDAAPVNKKHGGFDRKSGTGKPGGQSKNGRGNHGFGNAEQDAADAEKNPTAVLEGESYDNEDGETVEEPEPEVPSLSMEEFLAQKAATASNLSKLVGTKTARAVKQEGEFVKKAEVGTLIESTVSAKEQGPKGVSKRLQSKQVVDVSYGFNLGNNDREDRPPRREFNNRDGDRPPRAPRADGDRPARAPRADGDRPARAPRADFNKDKKGGDRRDGNQNKPRPAKGGVNLADANAFPSL